MYLIEGNRLKILCWAEQIEDDALAQARNLANLPFARRHVALMPDAHSGYGMPIGGVLATKDTIVPNAVGVDIGCGMRAVKLPAQASELYKKRDAILNDIQRSIPTGFNWHKKPQDHALFKTAPDIPVIRAELDNARRQLGTLGGGNHFIELQKDENDGAWVMIHSGSRNLGKKTCDEYNRLAREKNFYHLPDSWQLWGLPADSGAGREYLSAMRFCLDFARTNREHMMKIVLGIIEKHLKVETGGLDQVDVHHNYAAVERHGKEDLIIHRKGAVRAEGTVIIPGSMGAPSYICRGLSNPDSFVSCSHGAGRVMGRNAARKKYSVESVLKEMRDLDISLYKANKKDVAEECSAVYKDISAVMAQQRDLVEIMLELRPMGVVKG
ncbi:MAG: RtcB family protein [Peptococcaceae bacterium]|nr:RtcB family protein [Peptococcaceae bacterium]